MLCDDHVQGPCLIFQEHAQSESIEKKCTASSNIQLLTRERVGWTTEYMFLPIANREHRNHIDRQTCTSFAFPAWRYYLSVRCCDKIGLDVRMRVGLASCLLPPSSSRTGAGIACTKHHGTTWTKNASNAFAPGLKDLQKEYQEAAFLRGRSGSSPSAAIGSRQVAVASRTAAHLRRQVGRMTSADEVAALVSGAPVSVQGRRRRPQRMHATRCANKQLAQGHAAAATGCGWGVGIPSWGRPPGRAPCSSWECSAQPSRRICRILPFIILLKFTSLYMNSPSPTSLASAPCTAALALPSRSPIRLWTPSPQAAHSTAPQKLARVCDEPSIPAQFPRSVHSTATQPAL
eukprot:6212048-Pleurochrysis_carterae.AAC.4